MPDAPSQRDISALADVQPPAWARGHGPVATFGSMAGVLARRWRFVSYVMVGLPLACLLYCLIAPNQYEADARIALSGSPASTLKLEGANEAGEGSFASGQTQLETLADVFRSDQLAWMVIRGEKLYQAAGFEGSFARRFPGFRDDAAGAEAQAYLLDRFRKRLKVRTIPRTMVLEVRFRSRDPALSAAVVNGLIQAYREQDTESRLRATSEATGALGVQLSDLKARVAADDERLAQFQKEHGLVDTPETSANGQPSDVEHAAALEEIDELGRELVAATADRILRETEYRAAARGAPESVVATDPRLESQDASFATGLLKQLHGRHSDLEQEEAQLNIEHGPNYPRLVEIHTQLEDLDQQIKAEDARLTQRFEDAWKAAVDRERLVRESLGKSTAEGMKLNEAATEYAAMRQEANSSHQLYVRILEKAEEAGLTAGIRSSNISVIDSAREPVKPVSPDLGVYLAITFFVSLWVAIGGVLLLESRSSAVARAAVWVLGLTLMGLSARAQAPTPSTSGLPTGVARIPPASEARSKPDARAAPATWEGAGGGEQAGVAGNASAAAVSAAPIAAGDVVEVSEFHTPEIHSIVRVSETGSVVLPLAGEVEINGMNEATAAHAVEAALVARGMLRHPQVRVMVTVYAGQDVSVMGEVVRPGVYPYAPHHRLLDLISAASGLAPSAGSLVTILHREDQKSPVAVMLDVAGNAEAGDHNPELAPGDTVEVSRAGLVYVIGDVMRPGGFPVDRVQRLTVVQALTLAWGPTPNAALGKALLIREQKGGRTLTSLNLKRMLRGEDPDLPIEDRDIVFVPDSAARNLWNRTMESVVQSAAGVSIYAGMVYSQRF